MQLATSPDSESELSPMPCPSRGPNRASHRARRRPGFTRLPRPGCRLAATDPASLASVSHHRLLVSPTRQGSGQASVMVVLARIRTTITASESHRAGEATAGSHATCPAAARLHSPHQSRGDPASLASVTGTVAPSPGGNASAATRGAPGPRPPHWRLPGPGFARLISAAAQLPLPPSQSLSPGRQ